MRLMLVPMVLLLGATAPPVPRPFALPATSWCGGDPATVAGKTALLPGYGKGGFAIRTKSPEAQAFFDNGMQLAHAFAHKAAIAAFQEARRLDPDCAMCAWGEAWSSGPTINYGISPDDAKKLAEIAATAERLAVDGPVRERNLISALRLRYPEKGDGNRAFADAMDAIARQRPDDDAVATLAADALMIASDWKPESMARPVALLETVLKRTPDYAPAIHFYIHATEGAGYPARAEPYADRLGTLAPAASHLVHMPSHTYYWIGRYADAAAVNLRAANMGKGDAAILAIPDPDAVWKVMYHAHNVQFGIGGALMSGDAETGLTLARPMVDYAPRFPKPPVFAQIALGTAYVAIARFAPPDEMLAVADPGAASPAARLMWRYARGEAYARKGDWKAVRREANAIPSKLPNDMDRLAPRMAEVARLVLAGRIATGRGDHAEAARRFAAAAAIEEAKPLADFADPPPWWYPVRRDVAAALLAMGDAKGALVAADASLAHRPRDPVALELRGKAQVRLGNATAARNDLRAARRARHRTSG